MEADRPWSDLHRDLLVSIANAGSVSLRDYGCLRAVCTAWRSALDPPSFPCLLSLSDDDKGWYNASVFSLPMRRPFHLHTASSTLEGRGDHHQAGSLDSEVHASVFSSLTMSRPFRSRARVVGSSNGRFAVAVDHSSPTGDERTAFLTCCTKKIFILDPRAGKEVALAAPTAALNCESGPCHEFVRKVVFPPNPDDGTVVALHDRKFIACINVANSRDKWATIDIVAGNTEYLADLTLGNDGKLYCLDSNGGVHVVRIPIPRGGRNKSAVVDPSSDLLSYDFYLYPGVRAFGPRYGIASTRTNTKHIFICHGSLYQVWRNSDATFNSGGFRMSVDEILVLRYVPRRHPCWDVVKDLGGCSVFIDKSNSPAVVRAAGVPGLRADCVYWINWMRVPMVCDIATGISKPYILSSCKGNCWYFGRDDMASIKAASGEIKHQDDQSVTRPKG